MFTAVQHKHGTDLFTDGFFQVREGSDGRLRAFRLDDLERVDKVAKPVRIYAKGYWQTVTQVSEADSDGINKRRGRVVKINAFLGRAGV